MIRFNPKLIYILLISFILMGLVGCDYVGPNHTRQLSDGDYELLYNAEPIMNCRMDYTILAEFRLEDTTVSLDMTGTGALVVQEDSLIPNMEFDMIGYVRSGEQRGRFQIELREISGAFYIRATNLDSGASTGWLAIVITDILQELGLNLNEPENWEESAIDPSIEELLDTVGDFGLYTFTDVRSLGEEPTDGVNAKRFRLDVRLLDMISSPEMVELVIWALTFGQAENMLGLDLSPQRLQQITPVLDYLVEYIVPSFDWTVDQYVGLSVEPYLRRSKTTIDIDIDLQGIVMLQEALSGNLNLAAPSGFDEPLNIFFYMNTGYFDYGEPIDIIAPDEATRVPIEEFFMPFIFE